MKSSSVVWAYLAIVLLLSWILRTTSSREGMEGSCPAERDKHRVCERPMEGPKDGDRVYPNIYGPSYTPPPKRYDNDNGLFDSSTAGDNTFYTNILMPAGTLTLPANLTTAFPTAGPPEPYLTDFQGFHR